MYSRTCISAIYDYSQHHRYECYDLFLHNYVDIDVFRHFTNVVVYLQWLAIS